MPQNIDPENKQLHRVKLGHLTMYKNGRLKKVQAVCGKVWAPTFPVNRERQHDKCPICFPTEENRYGIAC